MDSPNSNSTAGPGGGAGSSNSNINNNNNDTHQQSFYPPPTNFNQLPAMSLPPNFDLNSLSPADREIFLRRFQQQQQLQRARQAQNIHMQQQQQQQQQRMTMNAYSTPRPPIGQMNSINPLNVMNPMSTINPMAMNINGPYQTFRGPSGINPALLQSGGVVPPSKPPVVVNSQQMTHINPQQFTNPLSSVSGLKQADPVLFNVNNPQKPTSTSSSLNLPPLDEQVMSSEGNFVDHLIKFLDAIKFTNRVVPQIANRPISLFRLFQIVNSSGGFVAVGEAKKWPLVTQALQFPAQSYEVVSTVRATYYTFLYAYEQYFIQKRPLDKIDWPNPPTKQQQPTPAPTVQVPVQTQTPTPKPPQSQQPQLPQVPQNPVPAPVAFNPQALKFIPENDLSLWKSFANAMKVPIGPVTDLETAILYLNSPYATLKIEALLATQRLFAHGTPKDLQTAKVSIESLNTLLESLERIWKETRSKTRDSDMIKAKTMEEYWREVDVKKRSILDRNVDNDDEMRDLLICRQIASIMRTLTSTRGPEVWSILGKSDFIQQTFLPACLWKIGDWELYKDALIVFEAVSSHMPSEPDSELFKWSLQKCQVELVQVRHDRLLALAAKFPNFNRLGSFDSLPAARQAVSILITKCAQLWKSVPSHVFLHLSTCLNLLTSSDDIDNNLKSFVKAVESFLSIFILPTVSLLKSVRALFECTLANSSNNLEELRRILETVFYSPAFSLTDGGFLELCLQLIVKCQAHQPDCLDDFDWTGVYCLARELREFWRHSSCDSVITNLGKACYAVNSLTGSSPAKKASSYKQNHQQQQLPLAILTNSQSISAVFSHPFLLLTKCLSLLTTNFPILPDSIKLDLLELAVEWNLATPSKWGREVLGSEKFEESLSILRDFYF